MDEARLAYLRQTVENWAFDRICKQVSGDIALDSITVTIDAFGRRPLPLAMDVREREPEYASERDRMDAMPIHFGLHARWNQGGNGCLVACETEHEGAKEVADAFMLCIRNRENAKPIIIDDMKMDEVSSGQLAFEF